MPQQDPYESIAKPDPYASIANTERPTSNKSDPSVTSSVEKPPEWYTKRGLKVLGYKAADKALDLLPTAGGVVGGLLGGGGGIETGPGALATGAAGAAFGGATGEAARQLGKRKLFGTGPETSLESAKEIGKQGGIQAASEVLGRVGGKAFTPAIKYLDKTAMTSKAAGFRMLPSEAAGEAPSYLERFLKGSVMTSGKMDRFRLAQNLETKQAAEKVANEISSFSGSSEQLGKMVQDGIKAHTEEFHKIQNQMYGEIDKMVKGTEKQVPFERPTTGRYKPPVRMVTKIEGGVYPQTFDIKSFAEQQLKRLKEEEKILDPALLSRSRGMLNTLANAPNRMSYQAIAAARSDALSTARELEQALAGKEAGMAKKIAELFDQSMMKAAEESGIPGLPQKIRAANAFTKEEHRMFEQQLVKKVVDSKKPEAIAKFVRAPNVGIQETRDLFKVLPPALRPQVQKQIMLDAMRESVNTQTGAFNERKFATAITKLGEERGSEIFGKNWNNVRELSKLMGQVNGPAGKGGGAGAALQNFSVLKNLMLTVAAPIGLASSHHVGAGAATLAGEWASLNIIAAAMTNPEKAAAMLRVARSFTKTVPFMATGAINVTKDRYGPPKPPRKLEVPKVEETE